MAYYQPIEGGSEIELQGIKIYLPPVGYGVDEYGEVKETEILSRPGGAKEQYWEVPFDKAGYKEARKKELQRVQAGDEHSVHLNEMRTTEWHRRMYGVWFLNYDPKTDEVVPTYLTGFHYFYLTHWYIGSKNPHGLPSYWDDAREVLYALRFAETHPELGGLLFSTKRRYGKTALSAAWAYERASRKRNHLALMQSKTEHDAQTIMYRQAMLRAFSRLPDFFRPTYDTSGGVLPTRGLDFRSPRRRSGKEAQAFFANVDQDLDSTIKPISSNTYAADGTAAGTLVQDEIFKLGARVNMAERHRVNDFALKDYNSDYVGKVLATSTVEEIETGTGVNSLDRIVQFWKDSSPELFYKMGKTPTGMIHFFVAADRARDRDRYGRADAKRNRAEIMKERQGYAGQPEALMSYIRKEPLTVEEAFRSSRRQCHFDQVKIQDRLDYLLWQEPELTFRGDLVFTSRPGLDVDPTSVHVKFVPSSNGRWVFRYDAFENFNPCDNRVVGNRLTPTNTHRFAIGSDPFAADTPAWGVGSKGSIYVLRKARSMEGEEHDDFICQYLERPATVDELAEDILKTALFFSCEALIERNRPGVMQHIRRLGFYPFLMTAPGEVKAGVHTTKLVIREIIENWQIYVGTSVDRIVFAELLQDLLDFDASDTQRSDATMGSGFALIAANRTLKRSQTHSSPNYIRLFGGRERKRRRNAHIR